MQTSTFLQTQIVWILIGLIIVGLIASVIFSTPKGKSFLYSTIMQIPVFGDLTKSYRLIKFARYMKLMVGAGLNYVETFRLMREIMEAPLYKEMSTHVLHGLEQGESIFSRMEDFTDILPRDVLVLLKVGEETATLKESLDNVVDMYSEELELKIRSISKVIEPIMIIFVGGIVGMIAISVFGIIGSVLDALPSI
jgi:type IV pilus assembly protein PilC